MMQHVHAGADRLCRERCGGAFERVARHVGAASDACTLLHNFRACGATSAPHSGKTPSNRVTKLKHSKKLITSGKC